MSDLQIRKATRQDGERNSHWKGGQITTKDGRVMLHSPDHPWPSKGKYVYRYRLVMEKHLGRYLQPSEVVHHKNGVNNDDRLENLELLTPSAHSLIHAARHAGRWSTKYDRCVRCGTTESEHGGHGLCNRCRDKERWPARFARQKEKERQVAS